MSEQQLDQFDLETSLAASFIRPEKEFKGMKVKRCTAGTESIMHLTGNTIFRSSTANADDGSGFLYSIWSYLFVHTQDRKTVLAAAFNKDPIIYKMAVTDWSDQFGSSDTEEALNIVTEEIKEYRDARIEIEKDPNHMAPPQGNE